MVTIYLDLINGHHVKVKPIARDGNKIEVEILENKCGFSKGEILTRYYRDLFVIAGHTAGGRIRGIAPDLSFL